MSANKWIVANSIAVVLAAVAGGAQAQTNAPMAPTTQSQPMTTAPTPTGTQETGGPSSSAPAQLSTTSTTWTNSSMSGAPVDYKVLLNKPYDYNDLMAAKAKGYDDSHIAMFANLAEKAGVPFNEIVSEVNRGWTFAAIGQKYGLTDAQIYDAQDKIGEIKDYKTAYLGVTPPDSNLYAEAVSRRDNALMARALAPSPLPTLSPIATSSTSEVAQNTTTTTVTPTPTPAPVETAEAAPVPAEHTVLAHRTMTKTVRVYTPMHRHHRYAHIMRRRHYHTWRPMAHHVKRYRHHAAPAMYNRGS